MRLIICGGRTFTDRLTLQRAIDAWVNTFGRPSLVIEGGATGADALGREFAEAAGVPVRTFKADWATHGKRAGPMRNREMAEYAAADPNGPGGCLALPGGIGTLDMVKQARAAGLVIMEVTL